MADELTPTQALALWGLLAKQGRAKATEVKKSERDALMAGGYAEADKPAKAVTLTERGWHWAATHFDAPLPPAQRPLQDLLVRLGAHLVASDGTLADFIGEAPPLPAPEKAPKPKAPPKPRAPTAAKLRQMIEDAYLRASGGARSEPVRLSRLRAELGGLDRKTVDAGLARIAKAKREKASLSQISDNKAIDAAEREAAFSPAGEPFHLIRIQ